MQKIVKLILMVCLALPVGAESPEDAFIVRNAALVNSDGTWWAFDGVRPLVISSIETASLAFPNLRIAGGALHIDNRTSVSVDGHLFNEAGTNGLVLRSGEEGTASLIHHNTGVLATIERYVPAVDDWHTQPATDWHMLSAPVYGQEIQAFIPDADQGGYDFYGWNEVDNIWMNVKQEEDFIAFNDGLLFNEGQGYLVAYEMAQLFSFQGEMPVVDIISNNLTNSGPGDHAGWHLLGNPYAAALDWNDEHWQRYGVHEEVHVWDSQRGNYISNANGIGDFDGIIQPHQAMFVKAADRNKAASLHIPAAARKHLSGIDSRRDSVPPDVIRLVITSDETGYFDAAFLKVTDMASAGFDPQHDAHKLQGNAHAPGLYTLKEGRSLSVHTIPHPEAETQVPLCFVPGNAGQLRLTTSDLYAFYPEYDLLLWDKATGNLADMREQTQYQFTPNNPEDDCRFRLIISRADGDATPVNLAAGQHLRIFSYEQTIWVDVPAQQVPARLLVTGMDGRRLLSKKIAGAGLHAVPAPQSPALLVVTLVAESATKSKKIRIH